MENLGSMNPLSVHQPNRPRASGTISRYFSKIEARRHKHASQSDEYYRDVQTQMHAKWYSGEWNRLNPPKKVDFVQCWVLNIMDRPGASPASPNAEIHAFFIF